METIFPLKELASFTGNIYEITVAASRRAYQMVRIGDSELDKYAGKAVSLAAKQLFTGTVKYQIEKAK